MKQRLFQIAGVVLVALALGAAPQASARDVFELSIDVDNDGTEELFVGLSTFEESIDLLDHSRLSRRIDYRGDEAVSIELFLRGLDAALVFPTQGNGDLAFSIAAGGRALPLGPDGGTVQFTPRNPNGNVIEQREDTLEQLKDYLKENKGALKTIFAAFARYSPIDPLAGNPDSLFGKKMKGDMDHGFKHKVSQVWGCGTSAFNMHDDQPILIAATGELGDIFAEAQDRAAYLQAQNEFGIGMTYTSAKAETDSGSYNTTSILVPISYTAKLDFNPSHKVRFDFPIGYSDTEGATAVSLGMGLAYTFPVSGVWTLTPAAGVGATGSVDLLSAGGVNSFSLTSAYTWRLSDWALSMGNSIGKYSSIDLKLGEVEAGADISNTAFTNGVILTGPNSLISKNLVMEYSFTNTQIMGDDVYTNQYNEIGVALGRMGMDMGIIDNYMKFGLSYLVATGDFADITATKLNFAARF